jgi:hypothetical protein
MNNVWQDCCFWEDLLIGNVTVASGVWEFVLASHQEKPPLENYLQFGAISFLLSKPGKFKEMEGNILYFLGWFNFLVIAEIAV